MNTTIIRELINNGKLTKGQAIDALDDIIKGAEKAGGETTASEAKALMDELLSQVKAEELSSKKRARLGDALTALQYNAAVRNGDLDDQLHPVLRVKSDGVSMEDLLPGAIPLMAINAGTGDSVWVNPTILGKPDKVVDVPKVKLNPVGADLWAIHSQLGTRADGTRKGHATADGGFVMLHAGFSTPVDTPDFDFTRDFASMAMTSAESGNIIKLRIDDVTLAKGTQANQRLVNPYAINLSRKGSDGVKLQAVISKLASMYYTIVGYALVTDANFSVDRETQEIKSFKDKADLRLTTTALLLWAIPAAPAKPGMLKVRGISIDPRKPVLAQMPKRNTKTPEQAAKDAAAEAKATGNVEALINAFAEADASSAKTMADTILGEADL